MNREKSVKLPHEHREKVELICPVCGRIVKKLRIAKFCSDYCGLQASLVRRGLRKKVLVRYLDGEKYAKKYFDINGDLCETKIPFADEVNITIV